MDHETRKCASLLRKGGLTPWRYRPGTGIRKVQHREIVGKQAHKCHLNNLHPPPDESSDSEDENMTAPVVNALVHDVSQAWCEEAAMPGFFGFFPVSYVQ